MAETAVKKQEPQELSMSERFSQKVLQEFTGGKNDIALTDFQKRLVKNYFVAIDQALKKPGIPWNEVNLEGLAIDVVSCARIGFDPAQKNHINPVPFKNNATKKYDITFIEGYRGMEMKALKYGLDVPDAVIVELVYSFDKFKSIKKDLTHIESYEFEVVNHFDRGEVIGGFYYHAYTKNPAKNKLVVMSLKEILKRKPAWATKEFWGADKWYEKMCWKTVSRAAYNDITIDSQKIDDDYLRLKSMESKLSEAQIVDIIAENANTGDVLDIKAEAIDPETGLTIDSVTGEATKAVQKSIPKEEIEKTKRCPNGVAEQGTLLDEPGY